MPPERDWRAPLNETGDDALQYTDIAIGYLGRNTRYRAEYQRALGRVKRGAAFDRKLAVARPDLSPASIILAPAVAGIGAGPLDLAALGDIRARIRMGDVLHVILADPDGDEHLCVCGSRHDAMALMVPIEPAPFARLASAERLCRRLSGMAAGPRYARRPSGANISSPCCKCSTVAARAPASESWPPR